MNKMTVAKLKEILAMYPDTLVVRVSQNYTGTDAYSVVDAAPLTAPPSGPFEPGELIFAVIAD